MSLRAALEETLPPICSAEDVAIALGLTVAAIRHHAKTGKLPPPVKLGSAPQAPVRWSRADVVNAYCGEPE